MHVVRCIEALFLCDDWLKLYNGLSRMKPHYSYLESLLKKNS